MRYVHVPEPVTLVSDDRRVPLARQMSDGSMEPYVMDLRHFVEAFVVNDEQFGKGMKAIRAAIKILNVVDNVQPGSVIGLEDADWEIVRNVLENPTLAIGTGGNTVRLDVMRQSSVFAEALLGAKSEK